MSRLPFAQLMLLVTFDLVLAFATLASIVWLLARRRDWRAPSRRRPWCAALLVGAGLLMLACLPTTWGKVSGDVLSVPLMDLEARPADTFVGVVACGVSAALLAAHAAFVLRAQDPRVLVVTSLLLASAWAGLTVDVMFAASAINDLANLGPAQAAGRATVGLAAWLELAAAAATASATILSRGVPVTRKATKGAQAVDALTTTAELDASEWEIGASLHYPAPLALPGPLAAPTSWGPLSATPDPGLPAPEHAWTKQSGEHQ